MGTIHWSEPTCLKERPSRASLLKYDRQDDLTAKKDITMGHLNGMHVPPQPERTWLDQALTFLSTIAHWLGQLIVGIVNRIVPDLISEGLIDPIGYLALLTIVLVLIGVFEALKRAFYWIVGLGWLLIIVRIILDKLRI
jgi:hypothetical protein